MADESGTRLSPGYICCSKYGQSKNISCMHIYMPRTQIFCTASSEWSLQRNSAEGGVG